LIKISIIGFGKTGSHLYYALKKAKNAKVVYVIKNRRQKYSAEILSKSDVIFICTGDKDIAGAMKKLMVSKADLKNKIIFHTSGAKSSHQFDKLKTEGAVTGSFHPVQTFAEKTKRYSGTFENIYIAIEGNRKAVNAGFKIAKAIHSKPFEITAASKPFHHICCVISSNYLTALMNLASQVFAAGSRKGIRKIGFNNTTFFDIYKPLVAETLQNIEKIGVIEALTGPIERNDTDTIWLHIDSIKKAVPEILPAYVILGIETVKLALKKKKLRSSEAVSIIKLLNKY
jgi:predicted short-subunit dehydrogenase-like oxidoreductase (DUF2520 family)